MNQIRQASRAIWLFSILFLASFSTPAFAKTAEIDAMVERAISRVYPALVQIYVVTTYHDSGRERKTEGAGSGAIISPEGYVVTNHHVAGRATAIRCILSTKEEIEATLVGTDPLSDIAVLKLDLSSRKLKTPLPVAQFGSSAEMKIGDPVLAMGCPLALSQSVTRGIVANKDMMLSKFLGDQFLLDGEDVGSLVKWIGHDAQIQPGNSGGPLVNLNGEIVGINEIGLGSMSGAIPSDLARIIVQELIKDGKIQRSWIGANFQPLLKGGNQTSNGMISRKPDDLGVLVAGVTPGSPAEAAGLQKGDVVMSVDDTPVKVHFREELPAFHMLVLSKAVGENLKFKVFRDGKNETITIKTELRDGAEGKEKESKEWGLVVEEITTMVSKELQRPNKKGVLVRSVRPGGPTDQATPALLPNDIILKIGEKEVADKKSFLQMTEKIVEGQKSPVATPITFERKAEQLVTVVEVGIRELPDPTQEVRKAWLPIATQVVSKRLAGILKLTAGKGVRVTQVYPPDDGKESDFKVGDILTHIDGGLIEASEPQDSSVFETMIRAYRIGSKPEITAVRDGQQIKISPTLRERPRPEKEFKIYEDFDLEFKARDISYFDRIRHRWSKEEFGALVTQVELGGWAGVDGLDEGDIIQQVDGQKVTKIADLESLMKGIKEKKSKRIVMLVKRGILSRFLELEPSWPSINE
jgi:serine protease Do